MDDESDIRNAADRLMKESRLGSADTQTPVTGLSGGLGDTNSTNTSSSHSTTNPISSAGGIGRQFNPSGSIGSVGEKLGGPFSKDGAIGSQFDASKSGIAGKVESMVGGPRKGGQSGMGGIGDMGDFGTHRGMGDGLRDTSGIPPGQDEAGGLSREWKK